MNIRRALKKDCERIVNELWKPFMEYCSSLDEFSNLDREAETIFYNHLCDFVSNQNNIVYIAEDPPAIIGYVKATKTSRSPVYETKLVGEISDVFVKPEYRKTGIGYQLIEKAEEWFRENGLELAWLKVHSGNELGRAFWERVGYKDYMIEKMKKIGEQNE